MEYLSSDRILVVDLATGETTEDELSEDLVAEKIGGAAINKYLYEAHADADPVVLGAGLLTGTLFTATCASVLTGKSPITGKVCHVPVTQKVGLEFKYVGFDYVVIKNAAAGPSFLWLHDGVADVVDASDYAGKDVWATTRAFRAAMGDDLIQTIVIGPAGEKGSDAAQVCYNFWGSGDRFGFGKLFGQKNLKGIAMRGMGLLECADPEEYAVASLDILEDIKQGATAGKAGLADIAAAIGESDLADYIAPVVHRSSACYNTPVPTNTFLYLDEDPNTIVEPDVEEPGVLVTDLFGLLAFKKLGMPVQDAGRLLQACARRGVDPVAAAELSGKTGAADIEAALDSLSGAPTIAGEGVFSPWCPMQPIFGDFDVAGDAVADWWERRQAIAYTFGLHPIFAVMSPEITEDSLIDMVDIGAEIEIGEDTINSVAAYLRG